jgi:hypothetical protein
MASAPFDGNGSVMIALGRLHANEDYQPRLDGLSESHVRLLTQTDPTTWPPLLVTPNGLGDWDVLDGFHRHEAARRLGLAELACVVANGAGYPEAVAANLAHGLPLSLADRKDFARWLHSQHPDLSLREIGRRCGLNHETVRRALETDEGDAGENRQSAPADPVRKLVQQVVRTYQTGAGRTWLGFGKAGNPRPFRRAIEAAPDDKQAAVAEAVYAFGRACVDAAAPYVGTDS